MARATICIAVDEPADVRTGAQWLAANRERLEFISDNYDCGCCVDLYDLEGSPEVLDTIPASIACDSDWTKYGRVALVVTETGKQR